MEDKKVVCAADIGYGNSKYVRFVTPEGEIRCESFPSVAPQAAHSTLAAGVLGRRKTINVEVGAASYEVGEDATISRVEHKRGGAEFYRHEIQKQFPGRSIITVRENLQANVIGFQLFGVGTVRKRQTRDVCC